MSALSPEVVEFLAGPISVMVSSRDKALVPSIARAVALRPGEDGQSLTVWLVEDAAKDLLADLRACGVVAVVANRPVTHRTVQFKGKVTHVGPAEEADRPYVEAQVARFVEELVFTGMSRKHLARFRHWPVVAVEIAVSGVFDQTPGPRAGERLQVAP